MMITQPEKPQMRNAQVLSALPASALTIERMNFHNWMDTRSAEFHADGLRMMNTDRYFSPSVPTANSRNSNIPQNLHFGANQFDFVGGPIVPKHEFTFDGISSVNSEFHHQASSANYLPPRVFSPVSPPASVSKNSDCANLNFDLDSDDEDQEPADPKQQHFQTYRERRREAHTQAEQKRRDGIKKGYEELHQVLPQSQTKDPVGNQKASKAVVLQKSIDYLNYLIDGKTRQQEELNCLRRELSGLQIMKQNYEKMARNIRHADLPGQDPLPETVKFHVFQFIMEDLFQSFDAAVKPSCFAELSGTAFAWLEECCTPLRLHQITKAVLLNLQCNKAAFPSGPSVPRHRNSW